MTIIVIAILFMLVVVIRSYSYIDNNSVETIDVIKALIPAVIGLVCLGVRATYFALPEGAMVSSEYIMYRNILMGVFLAMMGYVVRAGIYSSVYIYRNKKG